MEVKRRRKAELSWAERSKIVFFHLHPLMGAKDLKLTSRVFGVNHNTLSSWLTSRQMIPKWISHVESIEASTVINFIPKTYQQAYVEMVPPSSKVDLRRYEQYRTENNPVMTTTSSSSTLLDASNTAGGEDIILFGPPSQSTQFSSTQHRNPSRKRQCLNANASLGRKRLYLEQEEMIMRAIRERWESGDPMTKAELRNAIVTNTPHDTDFFKKCCDPNSKGFPNYLNKFIARVLERGEFILKKKLIIERVPSDWRQRAELNASLISARMKVAGVDTVIAADELFLRFHDGTKDSGGDSNTTTTSSSSTIPTGNIMLNSPFHRNEPLGCIVYTAVDCVNALFLPPLVVFTGGQEFSAQEQMLWKDLKENGGCTVLHSSSPWVDPSTTVAWLEHVSRLYPRSKLGVILDSTSSHTDPSVSEWIANNRSEDDAGSVTVEFVEHTLASVYHPIHAALEHSYKQCIYSKIADYKRTMEASAGASVVAEKCPMTRQDLVQMLEDAGQDMTTSSKHNQMIPKAFKQCGVHPWGDDPSYFESHLDSLSVNIIYDRLLSGQQYIELL